MYLLIIIVILIIWGSKHFKQRETFINDIDKMLNDPSNRSSIGLPKLPDYNKIQADIIKSKQPVIEKRTVVRSVENKCRFIPSHTSTKCDNKVYKKFSGASLGIGSKSIQCNGAKILNNRAKAISIIKDGKVNKIVITKKGNYYKTDPVVKIEGNAKIKAIMQDKRIAKIVIINPGSGYKSSPRINIAAPNLYSYCNLCCTI